METLKRRDAPSRHRLAAVMAELSKLHAIAPPSEIVPAELDAALRSRFGKPATVRPLNVFGIGVRHAFGIPLDRFRVPERLKLTPEQRHEIESTVDRLLELGALFGPPEGIPVPGMEENDFYRAFGKNYIKGESRLAQGIRDYKVSKERLGTWLAASEVIDILDDLNEAPKAIWHPQRFESTIVVAGQEAMRSHRPDWPHR